MALPLLSLLLSFSFPFFFSLNQSFFPIFYLLIYYYFSFKFFLNYTFLIFFFPLIHSLLYSFSLNFFFPNFLSNFCLQPILVLTIPNRPKKNNLSISHHVFLPANPKSVFIQLFLNDASFTKNTRFF